MIYAVTKFTLKTDLDEEGFNKFLGKFVKLISGMEGFLGSQSFHNALNSLEGVVIYKWDNLSAWGSCLENRKFQRIRDQMSKYYVKATTEIWKEAPGV